MTHDEAKVSRRWAYIALVLGAGSSIAANIAHAWVVDEAPSKGAVASSVLWPLLTLVAVELLIKTVWRPGWGWSTVRFVGPSLVAAVAFLVSYRHMHSLLLSYGEDPVTAALGPVAIDGLMLTATAALLGRRTVEASTVERQPGPSTVERRPEPSTVERRPEASTVERRPEPSTVERRPEPSSVERQPGPSTVEPSASSPARRRMTVEERTEQARALIASGALPAQPSAAAILRELGGGGDVARKVRNALLADVEDQDQPEERAA
jgi:hypothetical protein